MSPFFKFAESETFNYLYFKTWPQDVLQFETWPINFDVGWNWQWKALSSPHVPPKHDV